MPNTILLIGHNPTATNILEFTLNQRHIDAIRLQQDALFAEQLPENPFDMVLFDVHDLHKAHIDAITALRAITTVPLLIMIPSGDSTAILQAYAAGADECVVKPIDPLVLLAKVEAWLRRAWTIPVEVLDEINIGDIRLNPARQQISVADRPPVKLTNLELRLMHLLVMHPNQVLPTDTIVHRVWGYLTPGDHTLVKNVIYRIRRKIEPDPSNPRYILAVAGEGYRFQVSQ
jgi:DNA-binding response OmpR family regulator